MSNCCMNLMPWSNQSVGIWFWSIIYAGVKESWCLLISEGWRSSNMTEILCWQSSVKALCWPQSRDVDVFIDKLFDYFSFLCHCKQPFLFLTCFCVREAPGTVCPSVAWVRCLALAWNLLCIKKLWRQWRQSVFWRGGPFRMPWWCHTMMELMLMNINQVMLNI